MTMDSCGKNKGTHTTPAIDPTKFWRSAPGMNIETVSVAAPDTDMEKRRAVKDSMERR